jgi:ADP-ribose pyrophosphatase
MRDEVVWSSPGLPRLEVLRRSDGSFHLRQQHGLAGVVVVAQQADGRILVGRHARPAVGRLLWELPRGFGESDDPCAEAERELFEETGYRATAAEVIGQVCPDSGLLASVVQVVRCQVAAVPDGAPDGELRELRWCTAGELLALVREDGTVDGLTAAALLLLLGVGCL